MAPFCVFLVHNKQCDAQALGARPWHHAGATLSCKPLCGACAQVMDSEKDIGPRFLDSKKKDRIKILTEKYIDAKCKA